MEYCLFISTPDNKELVLHREKVRTSGAGITPYVYVVDWTLPVGRGLSGLVDDELMCLDHLCNLDFVKAI